MRACTREKTNGFSTQCDFIFGRWIGICVLVSGCEWVGCEAADEVWNTGSGKHLHSAESSTRVQDVVCVCVCVRARLMVVVVGESDERVVLTALEFLGLLDRRRGARAETAASTVSSGIHPLAQRSYRDATLDATLDVHTPTPKIGTCDGCDYTDE